MLVSRSGVGISDLAEPMRVDFYQLSRDPAESAVARIAEAALKAGERLLVLSDDEAQRTRLGAALWARDGFLANGSADAPHAERQPVLVGGGDAGPANGARFVIYADGVWRGGEGFERAFLVFDAATIDGARAAWRGLDGGERRFWKQDGGKWVEGP